MRLDLPRVLMHRLAYMLVCLYIWFECLNLCTCKLCGLESFCSRTVQSLQIRKVEARLKVISAFGRVTKERGTLAFQLEDPRIYTASPKLPNPKHLIPEGLACILIR